MECDTGGESHCLPAEFFRVPPQEKSLPLKELVDEVGVSRKTLERQRKYIIAIALVLIGDFELLREYIA